MKSIGLSSCGDLLGSQMEQFQPLGLEFVDHVVATAAVPSSLTVIFLNSCFGLPDEPIAFLFLGNS